MKHVNIYRNVYVTIVIVLVMLIVLTPVFIRAGFSIVSEEFLEGLLIFVLLVVGIVIDSVYEREVRKQDRLLFDAWKHIGAVNLLVERLRTALTGGGEFPKEKSELRAFVREAFDKIRGVAPCFCLLLRVVETESGRTVFEQMFNDPSGECVMPNVGNNDFLAGKMIAGWRTVSSQSDTIKIKAFLILPDTVQLDTDKEMVVQKIINDFVAVYAVFAYVRPMMEAR